ncbi:MAG: phytoene/squalene synthase family protein [Candidatus Eremiobacteraeota bacterium]|nr:phytoene/squalene synthase family protein [Candidatus Eremiobacteraeota bacterium]
MDSKALTASYKACQEITRERAKNFYFGIKLLPQEKRDSLCAVYAFFRESDDLSDDEAISNKAERLARWKALVHPTGDGSHSPVLPAFYDTVEKYKIPTNYFEELIDGTTSDLTVTRYQSFEDLYGYCYKVASTVGLVCLHIFGFDGTPIALKQAEERGIAFQLTNILRDVKEDGERGRIYLPLEDLARFGLTEEQFLAGQASPEMESFLAFQIERAKGYYEASKELVGRVDPESRASLEAMTQIYRAVLGKVEDLGLKVFQQRASLSKMEKLALAGKTALSGAFKRS